MSLEKLLKKAGLIFLTAGSLTFNSQAQTEVIPEDEVQKVKTENVQILNGGSKSLPAEGKAAQNTFYIGGLRNPTNDVFAFSYLNGQPIPENEKVFENGLGINIAKTKIYIVHPAGTQVVIPYQATWIENRKEITAKELTPPSETVYHSSLTKKVEESMTKKDGSKNIVRKGVDYLMEPEKEREKDWISAKLQEGETFTEIEQWPKDESYLGALSARDIGRKIRFKLEFGTTNRIAPVRVYIKALAESRPGNQPEIRSEAHVFFRTSFTNKYAGLNQNPLKELQGVYATVIKVRGEMIPLAVFIKEQGQQSCEIRTFQPNDRGELEEITGSFRKVGKEWRLTGSRPDGRTTETNHFRHFQTAEQVERLLEKYDKAIKPFEERDDEAMKTVKRFPTRQNSEAAARAMNESMKATEKFRKEILVEGDP